MPAAWGKQEETELLHITAPLRAWTALAARRINLPSSPPAVWVLWRASAETALTASAGNAPANERHNNSAWKIREWLFLYFLFFHTVIFDNLSVVRYVLCRGMYVLQFLFWRWCHCLLDSKCFLSLMSKRKIRWRHFKGKKTMNSARQTCIESDTVAKSLNEILIRTFLQHMPQQLLIAGDSYIVRQRRYFNWGTFQERCCGHASELCLFLMVRRLCVSRTEPQEVEAEAECSSVKSVTKTRHPAIL